MVNETMTGWIIQIGKEYYMGYDYERGLCLKCGVISHAEIVIGEEEPISLAKDIWNDQFPDYDYGSFCDVKIHKCLIQILN